MEGEACQTEYYEISNLGTSSHLCCPICNNKISWGIGNICSTCFGIITHHKKYGLTFAKVIFPKPNEFRKNYSNSIFI